MTDRCRNCGRDHTGPLCWAEAAAEQFKPHTQINRPSQQELKEQIMSLAWVEQAGRDGARALIIPGRFRRWIRRAIRRATP